MALIGQDSPFAEPDERRVGRMPISLTARVILCKLSVCAYGPGAALVRHIHDMATFVPSQTDIDRHWHVIDANSQVLGRVATVAAKLLQGKHKPRYTPFLDMGDHVIIVNAEQVRLTGRKEDQKLYRRHSGYPGGLREDRAKVMRAQQPSRVLERAVRGMLPRTKLGNAMYRKLKVYAGPDHPHVAQKPTNYEVS